MNNNRPYCLFATPRSGSSPVYHALAAFFRTQGIQGVEEILNPRFGTFEEKNGNLIYSKTPEYRPDLEDEILKRRFELVQKNHGKIFFKVFPSSFRGEILPWMMKNYQFIVLERKNKFEQILSFLVSSSTGRWYELRDNPPEKGALTATMEDFVLIEQVLFHFEHLKHVVKPTIRLSYEDLLRTGPQRMLSQAGLTTDVSLNFSEMTEKQNEGQKLDFFNNPDEIRQWYRNSFLEKIFPLDKS